MSITKINSHFQVEIEDSIDKIIELEIERVGRYLSNLGNYSKMGYRLRLPNLTDITSASYSDIKAAVVHEVTNDKDEYLRFKEAYLDTISLILKNGVNDIARDLYGVDLPSNIKIVPSSYGTISSPVNIARGTPMVIRIDKYFEGVQPRTKIETLIHEIWAHGFTAQYRANTELDDNLGANTIKVYPKHKERLMDLFGRTLLVRSKLIERSKIVMQDSMYKDIKDEVDSAYYVDNTNQSELFVKDDGNLQKIIINVIDKIKK